MANFLTELERALEDRALSLSQEELLRGEACASLETYTGKTENHFDYLCVDHLPLFLRAVHLCLPYEQDMLIAYYMAGLTQAAIGKIFKIGQTNVSYRLRCALDSFARCLQTNTRSVRKKYVKKKHSKHTEVHRVDPDCLGKFRVQIGEPGWKSCFPPKSAVRYAATGGDGEGDQCSFSRR